MIDKMKKLIAIAFSCMSIAASACAAQASANYYDYIYGINNFKLVTAAQTSKSGADLNTTYSIVNNAIVDFPLTVYVKMTSQTTLISTIEKPQVIQAKLQYRVLPDGDWITVKSVTKNYGSIPLNAVPNAYFGKNNIWPKGLSRGTAIMIRYYTTDGNWEPGYLSDKCTAQLADRAVADVGTVYTLPNTFNYTYSKSAAPPALGGGWTPSFVITVIYSGKDRPVR